MFGSRLAGRLGTVCLLLVISGLSSAALADKDQRNVQVPGAAAAAPSPAPAAPAVVGVEAAIDRLQQSGRLASQPIDWVGLRSFYAAGAPALWVTPSGYSALGSYLLLQAPKAAAAGMPMTAEVQAALANLPPALAQGQAADAEALMSALYVAGAYDATSAPGLRTNTGAALLTSLRNAKDQPRAIATQFPS